MVISNAKALETRRVHGVEALLQCKDKGVVFGSTDEHIKATYLNVRTKVPVICPCCGEPRLISARTLLRTERGSLCQTCAIHQGLFVRAKRKKKVEFNSEHERFLELISHHSSLTRFLCRPWKIVA